jgi:hypothetical protein
MYFTNFIHPDTPEFLYARKASSLRAFFVITTLRNNMAKQHRKCIAEE